MEHFSNFMYANTFCRNFCTPTLLSQRRQICNLGVVGSNLTGRGNFRVGNFLDLTGNTHRYACHITCNVNCKWHRKVSANNCGNDRRYAEDTQCALEAARKAHHFFCSLKLSSLNFYGAFLKLYVRKHLLPIACLQRIVYQSHSY